VLRPPPAAEIAALARLGVRVEVIPLGLAGAVPSLARVALGDPRPLQVLLFERRQARRRVDALLEAGRFDVVHAQLVRTAPYLPADGGPPVVVDLIDALSTSFARRAGAERGPLGVVMRAEAERLAGAERALVAKAAACLVVSEVERQALGGGTGVRVVPNGVDGVAFAYREEGRVPGRVVFGGNLGYFPNVDGAAWLARDVLPRIRRMVPDAELRLVGARPARAVRTLARLPGVSLAVAVPDMALEVGAAAVAVVALRAGAGLQNKVLEAMAVGTPVVATSRAVAGLEVRAGEHVLVAEDAEGLAAATVEVLRDPVRARALARAGRAFVERHHRWEDSAAAVETAWQQE
jgi:glycosyltransferase involved in cell wall biosynthesis